MAGVTRYGYAESRDSETWLDLVTCRTREEAVTKALDLIECDVVYVCRCEPIDRAALLREALAQAAEWVLEVANENGGEVAPWWDDSLFNQSVESVADLRERLQHAGVAWLSQYPGPDVWQAKDITEHHRVVVQ